MSKEGVTEVSTEKFLKFLSYRLDNVDFAGHHKQSGAHKAYWLHNINVLYVVLSSADSCRNIHIYILDTYRRNDKDAGRLLYKNIYL